jgi:hypothetical protein
MESPNFTIGQLQQVFRQIQTTNKLNELINTLKLLASKYKNKDEYIKSVLDILESDGLISFKIKLLILKKIQANGTRSNQPKNIQYEILSSYIRARNQSIKKQYNYRIRERNSVLFKLEREKMNEIISNIPSFFRKVFALLNKGKLSHVNYRELYNNLDPFVAREHSQLRLRLLYNNIMRRPEKYRHFMQNKRKRNDENQNESKKKRTQ